MIVGTILGTIVIVLITVAVGLLVDRKYKLLPSPETLDAEQRKPPPPTHGPGEAPATAIRANDTQLAHLREQHCSTCRTKKTNTPDDTVRYDERELLVLHFTCPACVHSSVLYVERIP